MLKCLLFPVVDGFVLLSYLGTLVKNHIFSLGLFGNLSADTNKDFGQWWVLLKTGLQYKSIRHNL